jgi:dTDP-4-amino-4,6-dideoxygalactose transaminase
MKYKLASSTWGSEEVAAIHRVIESDMYSMGDEVALYEREFSDFFGSKYAVMTSSGSTANLLMIASLFFTQDSTRRLSRGDEIIVPAVSWSTTYFPLQQYGLHLKFVDIDKDTLNLDTSQLAEAITEKTKAILAVNLLGNPCDFDAINSLINGKNITLIEDNCESMGATFGGKQAGTFGLMGTFSSFFSHHIATMEGGCIVTDDEEIYHLLLCLRAHGWTRNLPETNLVAGVKSDDAFEEAFKFVLPGYNVRPLEMSGAIGREQLKKLSNFIDVRRSNASAFVEKFKDHPYLRIQKELGVSSWFGFSLVLAENSPVSRHELVLALNQNNIDCRPIVTGNFLKNKEVLSHFDYEVFSSVPNAEFIDAQGLFVGNQQDDIVDEINHLSEVIQKLFEA